MKIGNVEIRFVREHRFRHGGQAVLAQRSAVAIDDKTDYSGALAVPDTEPMWRAVHQILDQSEREIVEAAQKWAGANNERALNSLANSEGVAFIRRRLNEARTNALTRMR
jgi:hypothetical protein